MNSGRQPLAFRALFRLRPVPERRRSHPANRKQFRRSLALETFRQLREHRNKKSPGREMEAGTGAVQGKFVLDEVVVLPGFEFYLFRVV